jgi:NAD(P)-dependent dehydrogenase (short-subunit alcohol dehydrogenase family)
MNLDLEDKVVFVTGGTGAIGKAIVRAFIAEGAIVIFTCNRAEAKMADLMSSSKDGRCIGYKMAVTDQRGMEAIAKEVYETYKRIDILINNAGIAEVMPFPLIDEEDWDETFNVNAKGTFLTTKEIVRFMIKNGSGSIINIGSLAAERIMEVPVHYAASKAAVTGFTLSLARELARYNIRVNCVVPGLIDGGVGLNTPEKQRKQYIDFCLSGRLGTPEEVADFIVFMASSRASFVNGQIMQVDGGI